MDAFGGRYSADLHEDLECGACDVGGAWLGPRIPAHHLAVCPRGGWAAPLGLSLFTSERGTKITPTPAEGEGGPGDSMGSDTVSSYLTDVA